MPVPSEDCLFFGKGNMTDASSGAGIAYPSGPPNFTHGFQWRSCCSIFSSMCMFVLLSFFFWSLWCLSFFDLRIM